MLHLTLTARATQRDGGAAAGLGQNMVKARDIFFFLSLISREASVLVLRAG